MLLYQWRRSPGTWPLNGLGCSVRGPSCFRISGRLCGSTVMERSPTIRAALKAGLAAMATRQATLANCRISSDRITKG
ncbi:unnamed protein product [Boreogadus saida]